MSHPNVCLTYGTRVAFVHNGVKRIARVSRRNLNPHRKPGIGRVSYDLFIELDGKPTGWLVRNIKATELETVNG